MFKQYLKRTAICVFGLALYGLGNACGVIAGEVGTNAWNTLNIGVADTFHITFGMTNLIIGLVVIVIDLFGKGKIGLGTILNIAVISIFSDFWIRILRSSGLAAGTISGILLTLAGQIILSVSTIIYMIPELGCGPRDTLMIIVGKRFPNTPIGIVKFCVEIIVLIAGIILGAPFGIGTILVMALQASIFQLCCRLFRFEPRNLVHEDLLDTVRRIRSGLS